MRSSPIEWLGVVNARYQYFRHVVNKMACDQRLQLYVLVWLQA